MLEKVFVVTTELELDSRDKLSIYVTPNTALNRNIHTQKNIIFPLSKSWIVREHQFPGSSVNRSNWNVERDHKVPVGSGYGVLILAVLHRAFVGIKYSLLGYII